jgi:hypothetical protein
MVQRTAWMGLGEGCSWVCDPAGRDRRGVTELKASGLPNSSRPELQTEHTDSRTNVCYDGLVLVAAAVGCFVDLAKRWRLGVVYVVRDWL